MFQRRALLALPFALALLLITAADSPELRRYDRARGALRALVDRYPAAFPTLQRERLIESFQQLQAAAGYWTLAADNDAAIITRARSSAEGALMRALAVLDNSPILHRVSLPAAAALPAQRWASGAGVVLLRVSRPGAVADTIPDFLVHEADLAASAGPITLDIGTAATLYALVFVENAASGARPIELRSGAATLATLALEIAVPPPARLKVEIADAASPGRPTPAVVGLYSADSQLQIPPQALSFERAGFRYNEPPYRQKQAKARAYEQSHYWPGGPGMDKAFFVDGGFEATVPEGDYTLIVGKGFEYTPEVRTIRVSSAAARTERVNLKRWVDMPARGWYSGDGHVHFERRTPEANRDLMLWTQAEDVHLASVMRMGDALQTYFEQYAYGRSGRHAAGAYALVPGQEDPRTIGMGHTLHMNIAAPLRKPDDYYLYDLVFEEMRRQGALTGYAHVYQPPAMGFLVRQDMTLNVPAGRIDFVEISEFGEMDMKLYYEFLNLGFPLTASAGSDVPWGHSIGTSRVYAHIGAHTGAAFAPDAWFDAVKNGRTFITIGPMIELAVNGQLPGARISAKAGETVRITARAFGDRVLPRYLEIVAQGDVVRAVTGGGRELTLDFTMPVAGSTWIAARAAGAHTSPVYISSGGKKFWKISQVDELIENRLRQLDDIETLLKNGTALGREGTWNNPDVLRKNAAALRERVAAARRSYENLRAEARAERTLSN